MWRLLVAEEGERGAEDPDGLLYPGSPESQKPQRFLPKLGKNLLYFLIFQINS